MQCDVNRDVIGALLGHSLTSVTVVHYTPIRMEEMRKAINQLHYGERQSTLFYPVPYPAQMKTRYPDDRIGKARRGERRNRCHS